MHHTKNTKLIIYLKFLFDVTNLNQISWHIGSRYFWIEKQKSKEDLRHSSSKEVNIGNISGST